MIPITVGDRQNLFDIATQYYGSAAAIVELCLDNDLEFDADINTGDILQIREVMPDSADPVVAEYIQQNKIVVLGVNDSTPIDVLATNNEEFIITNDNNYIGA